MRARLEERGKSVKYVEYEDRDHYIDDAAARPACWSRSTGFSRGALERLNEKGRPCRTAPSYVVVPEPDQRE